MNFWIIIQNFIVIFWITKLFRIFAPLNKTHYYGAITT